MDKSEVINKIRQYRILLKDHFDIEKVYLFGSYARETNREDSDIDVAIIVKKIKGDYFSTTPLLWKLRRQIDDRIEPVLIEKDNDDSGFLEEIQKNGIEIGEA
jgi:predicted nucleotidyltransferase